MSKAVVVEPEAGDELRDGAAWYEEDRAGVGVELLNAVEAVFDALATSTTAAVLVPGFSIESRVRRVLLERFPYAVVFIETEEVVHVIAIAHFRREPGYWRDRVPK
jgi:toxin ParE1/3/4